MDGGTIMKKIPPKMVMLNTRSLVLSHNSSRSSKEQSGKLLLDKMEAENKLLVSQ